MAQRFFGEGLHSFDAPGISALGKRDCELKELTARHLEGNLGGQDGTMGTDLPPRVLPGHRLRRDRLGGGLGLERCFRPTQRTGAAFDEYEGRSVIFYTGQS